MRRKITVIICIVLVLTALISWRQYKKDRVAAERLMFYKEAIFRDSNEITHEQHLGKGFHLVETVAGKTYLIRFQNESMYKGIIEGYELKNRIIEYR